MGVHFFVKIYTDDYDNLLSIIKEKIENLFSGRKLVGSKTKTTKSIGNSRSSSYVIYRDAQGNVLKTVDIDARTGIRKSASLPDGRFIKYDEKGLPILTNANCKQMDLGGLDILI